MTSGRIGSRSRHTGFTLVEVLLALTLMGMLLALAYGGLRAATRAADKGQTILEESSQVRMAHQFVHGQLNQVLPLVFYESEDRSERAVFLGSADWVRFVAPMPGYLGFGGPQVQELAIVDGEKGRELVLYHSPLQGYEQRSLYESAPIVLLDGIESAAFSFLGRDENGELTGWVPEWQDPATLPESVALEVEFREGVYIQWPLLIASARIDPGALANIAGAQAAQPGYGSSIRDLINRRKREQE